MSWEPRRIDPSGKPGDDKSCDRCSWCAWETHVWSATLVICLMLALWTLSNLFPPDPAPCGGRGNPCPATTTTP